MSKHPLRFLLSALTLSAISLLAADPSPTADNIWKTARLREVVLTGGSNDVAALKAWVAAGANSCIGVEPALAHQNGLKVRGWFAMNTMDNRVLSSDVIKKMGAIGRDGAMIQPSDGLAPLLSEKAWLACVNNPLWREFAASALTKIEQDGYDGCHIDYANRADGCFCLYCQTRWKDWAQKHELTGALKLEDAADAKDQRTRMSLREFRIRNTMEFLQLLHEAGHKAKSDFVVGNNLHQDSSSVFQTVSGNHTDVINIEGAAFNDFPPESQQVLWLKFARAIAHGRPVVAMTHNIRRDTLGKPHSARISPDRLSVALAEVFSIGAGSWLGWGGIEGANLLREHQQRAMPFYALAAKLEPTLADMRPMGWLAVVFSPRSYLNSGQSRGQYFTLGQGLMKAHIPFAVFSETDLSVDQLRAFSGVILLDASALTDTGASVIETYIKGGGKVMTLGDDVGKYDMNWKERTAPLAWAPTNDKPRAYGQGAVYPVADEYLSGKSFGATQTANVKQQNIAPLALEGWSAARDVIGARGPEYGIVVDLHYADNSRLNNLAIEFSPGTHDWEFQRLLIKPEKQVRSANVRIQFRGRSGTAWFREIRFGEWNPKTQHITHNLLGTTLKPAGGKSVIAKPIADGDKGAWAPAREGFAVETQANFGHVMKVVSTGGVPVVAMNLPQTDIAQRVRQIVAPLLPAQPLITLAGPGAENVYCDASFTGDRLLLQFINYNAQLFPDALDADQVKNEKTLPVIGLKASLSLNLHPIAATWSAPGAADQPLPVASPLTFVLPKLDQWGVISLQLK